MDRIGEILKQRGLSKAAFAKMMGTSPQNINSLLKNPTRTKMEEIAEVLDIPAWQLFASPEEVASQEFVAFFYHKGRTCSPTSMKEILDVLETWNVSEFRKECHSRDFMDLCEKYKGESPVKSMIDSLCVLLASYGHPGAIDNCSCAEESEKDR